MHRIGRTARLGAEGDAISFACEIYAQSLPDIEAFIEQKLPVEPVTTELLTALPRKPREGVEVEAEEGESIGEIFKEAREQRAADDARRGGGRSGGRGPAGGAGRGRSGAGGEPRRERTPRPPRAPDAPVASASPKAAAAKVAAPVAAAEGERAPRKQRRRRGGQRLEGGDSATNLPPTVTREIKPTSAKPVAAESGPSLLSRLGRGLKSLVTRAPRSQH